MKPKKPSAAEIRYQAACREWLKEDEKARFNRTYCTTFCNKDHRPIPRGM